MELDVFLKAYKEENWKNYLKFCREANVDYKTKLGEITLPEDIAVVICYRLGEYEAEKWLHKQVPAIGNIQPKELLSNERGQNILREVLMRLPD
ncbi:MbcA/ParS/Xre antitoxin family protein [Paenibacillus sp. sgz5001063]|uniref:MbcA/ParS/Xre antitoxin family protein n=1 Tax=Paenibacillus sp. sgz5001063 TaxID=3242474 RepID=UPI0036D38755